MDLLWIVLKQMNMMFNRVHRRRRRNGNLGRSVNITRAMIAKKVDIAFGNLALGT